MLRIGNPVTTAEIRRNAMRIVLWPNAAMVIGTHTQMKSAMPAIPMTMDGAIAGANVKPILSGVKRSANTDNVKMTF